MKKIGFILVLTIAYYFSVAQPTGIKYEKYTTQNGLTQNETGALLQDSRGFLWIGTSWGLNRYDGNVMKQYNKAGINSLPDLTIRALAEDKEGNIWIATQNGLCCLDPFTEKFTQYSEGRSPGNIPEASCIVYVDRKNNVWVAGTNTVSLFNKKAGTFSVTPIITIGKDVRRNKYIDGFFEDSKGRFWIYTSFGFRLFDREHKTYRSYIFEETGGQSRVENATQAMFEDKDGTLWAGTWNGGLLRFNEQKDLFENYLVNGDPVGGMNSVHDINAITLNDHYYLLLATEGGLVLTDPASILSKGKLFVEKTISESDDRFKVSGKTRIRVDRQGNYWIAGSSGLSKIETSARPIQWKALPPGAGSAYHMVPSVDDPNIIFCTTPTGWWEYNVAKDSLSPKILPAGSEQMLCGLTRYIRDGNGYWLTSNSGVGFYDMHSNRVTDLSGLVKQRFYSNVRTGLICKDNFGKIWFTVYRSGLRIYDPSTGKLVSLLADSSVQGSLYGVSIYDMKQLADGSIFIAAGSDVYHIDPRTLTYKIVDCQKENGKFPDRLGPRKILVTKDHRILMLSLQRIYECVNDKLTPVYPATGLSDFIMDDLTQDATGNIWIITNLGLYRSSEDLKQWTNMSGKTDGINAENINEFVTRNGRDFNISGPGRFGFFSIDGFMKNENGPEVIINRLKTGDKEQYLVSLKKDKIGLSFKDAIELEISAINFISEKGNRIYYKLDGWDKDWKDLAGSTVRYEQLPPGDYTFNAKAVNQDGVWSKAEASLSFTVNPPFWRTWWFIALIVLAAFSILFAVYRYRLQQAINQERMRSRIATDLHDDIGATLSSISMYSEAVKNQVKEKMPQLESVLNKMGENSRDMVNSMSDIVWAINPENDDGRKLLQRMENYATDICAVKEIKLQFNADEKLRLASLSLEVRKNVYLIFKEAVNNAAKYSGAASMLIEISLQSKKLHLLVRDDGKGFDEAVIKRGNGLKNLQSRAKEIKGTLVIESMEGKGTTVVLECMI